MIIKINHFRGDLTDVSAKTATLVETIPDRLMLNRMFCMLSVDAVIVVLDAARLGNVDGYPAMTSRCVFCTLTNAATYTGLQPTFRQQLH